LPPLDRHRARMDFDAHLYGLLHTGNPGDVAFYRRWCADARTVLELGCGSGRLLAPLAADGRVVTGVDAHAGMCALARARVPGATVIEADMAAVRLPDRFDRVILPYNSLYCAPDDAGAVAVLANAARHLAPDGLVLFDGYLVSMDPEDLTDDEAPEWLTTLYDGPRRVEVFEQDRHQPATRDCAVTYVHRIRGPRGRSTTHTYTIQHHYLSPEVLPDLLARAGLRLVACFGELDESPLDDGDRLVVVATHADAAGPVIDTLPPPA
ncbi:MAG: methyltransferase domain-containing protein, partial [Myxococcales bacterium]|nr:methyltransferase domain-containing protein [Myxococcales bacterium]